jgi:multiple sugar transport system permease protein
MTDTNQTNGAAVVPTAGDGAHDRGTSSPPMRNPHRAFSDDRQFLALALAPTALVIIALVLAPIVYTIGLSFFEQNTLLRNWSFAGLGTFADVLSSDDFRRAFVNGLVYTLGSTVLAGLLGVGVALLLDCRFVGRGAVRALVIFPFIVPTIVVAFIWKFIFSGRGLINDLLRELGVSGPAITWLGDERTAMATVIVISAWAWFPFVAVTTLAALQNLPDDVYEAAALDGAGRVARFFTLTLPLLAPALMVILLIRAIWAFRNFEIIFLLTGGGPIGATEVLPIMAYREAFGSFRMGHASAVAVTMMVLVTLLAAAYFRLSARVRRATGAV